MSLVKQYGQDAEMVEERAVVVARIPESAKRWCALAALLNDCETLARDYADPQRVARMLWEDVVDTYQACRYDIRHGAIAA